MQGPSDGIPMRPHVVSFSVDIPENLPREIFQGATLKEGGKVTCVIDGKKHETTWTIDEGISRDEKNLIIDALESKINQARRFIDDDEDDDESTVETKDIIEQMQAIIGKLVEQ